MVKAFCCFKKDNVQELSDFPRKEICQNSWGLQDGQGQWAKADVGDGMVKNQVMLQTQGPGREDAGRAELSGGVWGELLGPRTGEADPTNIY